MSILCRRYLASTRSDPARADDLLSCVAFCDVSATLVIA